MLQSIIHYTLHFIAIGVIAYWFDKKNWKQNWLILIATMLVDIDHVFANPLFDPNRCGIRYHPLHSELAILGYILGIFLIKNKILKLIFIGLLFHMITDSIDCIWMFQYCEECYLNSEIYNWIH